MTRFAQSLLAFGLEIAGVAALAYWGFHAGTPTATRWLLGVGAPALMVLVWGVFLAGGGPRFPLPKPATIALKLVVFGACAAALHAAGRHTLGWVFGALAVLSVVGDALSPVAVTDGTATRA